MTDRLERSEPGPRCRKCNAPIYDPAASCYACLTFEPHVPDDLEQRLDTIEHLPASLVRSEHREPQAPAGGEMTYRVMMMLQCNASSIEEANRKLVDELRQTQWGLLRIVAGEGGALGIVLPPPVKEIV